MKNYSIDIETLGTNVCDTILSIGVCEFNLTTGAILDTIEITFDIDEDETIPCTKGTIAFWLQQATVNPDSVSHVFKNSPRVPVQEGLIELTKFFPDEPFNIWANGTKFDLGMVEYLLKQNNMKVPWAFNADRCMRTLRDLCGRINIDMEDFQEVKHAALSDAIWQAKYISACLNQLGVLRL